MSAHLEVHNRIIEIENINQSIRTLGVHITPTLEWKGQFEIMRKKLHVSITKLMATDINPYQAVIYYNAYMIKSMYFGYRIIELTIKQE